MAYKIMPVARDAVTVDVPEEVQKDLEGCWTYLQEAPDHVFLAEFDSTDELKLFRRQADTYLSTREGGALVLRKLRTDSLPDTSMRFTLKPPDAEAKRGRKTGDGTAAPEEAPEKRTRRKSAESAAQ